MKRRATVLLDESVYERLADRAKLRGRTVSDELRDAVEQLVGPELTRAPGENVNQWLLDLAAAADELAIDYEGPVPSSPEFKGWLRESMARAIEVQAVRDTSPK